MMITKIKNGIKSKFPIIFLFILLMIASFTFLYCTNAGVIFPKNFDISILIDENPFRKKIEMNKMTDITAIVESYGTINDEIHLQYENHEGTIIAYLNEKDIAKLNIGDEISLRGNIKYYNDDYIVIGDAIDIFPFTFKAKLLSIN